MALLQNTNGGGTVEFGDNSYTLSSTVYEYLVFNGLLYVVQLNCDSSQNAAYISTSGGVGYLDVMGYIFQR